MNSHRRWWSSLRVSLFGVVAGVLALLLAPCIRAAGHTWIEAKSPHFLVISDTSERATRSIAWQLEQVRTAVEAFWNWARVDLDKPLLVIAVGDEAGMKTLAPQFWEQRNGVRPASVFVSGLDRHYIALRADAKVPDTVGINPYVVAYWSYVNLIITTAIKRDMPLWLSRGLASVMSNTIVREARLDVGQPIPWHLQRLNTGSRLRLAELVTVDRTSSWYTDGERLSTFDAEAWALVHFFMFGDEGAHRQQFDRFLALVLNGTPQAGALEAAFGKIDAIETPFFTYLNRKIFQFLRVNLDASLKPESFVTRTLPESQALVAQAAFHTAMRRPIEARAAIADARKIDGSGAASYDVEGMLLDIDGKPEDARSSYAKAAQLGSAQFYTHYRLAQLLRAASAAEDAQREARAALAAAVTPAQRSMAQEFVTRAPADASSSRSEQVPADARRPGNGVTLPRVLREVKPQYTVAARDARIAGLVTVECVVGVDGRVASARVVKSLDTVNGLDDEAVKAVKQWQFEPGSADGKPVPVIVSIELNFTLK